MNIKILTAVSAIALMGLAPAYADSKTSTEGNVKTPANIQIAQEISGNNPDTPDMPTMTQEDLREGWEKTKASTRNTYEKTKAVLIDSDDNVTEISDFTVDYRMTARGIIDKPVYNMAGEKIGEVDDILMNKDGKAETVVIRHGGFLGMGDREAAFDYSLVMNRAADGDVIMPLSEETVEEAVPFSYEPVNAEADRNVYTMLPGRMRVSRLLGSDVRDSEGKIVAEADNLYFHNGEAEHLVISLEEPLKINGDLVALDYDDLQLSRAGDDYTFSMSSEQSARLEQFRAQEHLAAAPYESLEPAAGDSTFVVPLNRRGVGLLQNKLNNHGYSSGPEDGLWGPKTRGALRSFQRNNDLEVTGTATGETLEELGIESARLEQFRTQEHLAAAPYESLEPAAGNATFVFPLNRHGVGLLQNKLNNHGYSSGPEDGLWGPKTRGALRSFQRNNDLEVTGTATGETLEELGIKY